MKLKIETSLFVKLNRIKLLCKHNWKKKEFRKKRIKNKENQAKKRIIKLFKRNNFNERMIINIKNMINPINQIINHCYF